MPDLLLLRLRIARLLPIVAVVLLFAAVTPHAASQEPRFPAPRLLPTPEAPLPQAGEIPPPGVAGPSLVPGRACDDSFWIVSSRQCPQSGIGPGIGCPLGYFRCGPDGRPYRFGQQAFQQSLQPGVPVCVVVHGSFTSWRDVCRESERTYRWLRAAAPDRPLQFIYYTWPSDGLLTLVPVVDLGLRGRRSAFNGIYLAQLMSQLPPESPVCLIGHSHGARAVVSALHLMGGGSVQGNRLTGLPTQQRRLRAVLAAAAVDHHWITPGGRYDRAVSRAESMINLRNHRDFVLCLYPFRRPFSQHALGSIGLTHQGRHLLSWQNAKVAELDVAPLIGPAHFWPSYYRRPEIAQAITPYVHFLDTGTPLMTQMLPPATAMGAGPAWVTPADTLVPLPGAGLKRPAPGPFLKESTRFPREGDGLY